MKKLFRGPRPGALVIAALVTALLLAAPAAADPADAQIAQLTQDQIDSPLFQAAAAAGLAQAAVQTALLASLEEQSSRADSADAYAGLDPEAAADLALSAFPETIAAPTWGPLSLPEGSELVAYIGKDQALIAPEGSGLDPANPPAADPGDGFHPRDLSEPAGLLVSTTPLRAPEQGHLEPVDPTLAEVAGSDLEPANAAVEAQMPVELADGITLNELDMTVTPEGAERAEERALIGPDKLFYANTDTDTDFIATSTPTGIEAFWQLRSAESADSASLTLDLPTGAELASDGLGGATITAAEGPIASVPAPSATDSDGTPVPVQMSVAGSDLELSFPHAEGDYHYPILVDPIIEDYNWATVPADCPALNTADNPALPWHWATSANTKFGGGCNTSGVTGILNQALGGKKLQPRRLRTVGLAPADRQLHLTGGVPQDPPYGAGWQLRCLRDPRHLAGGLGGRERDANEPDLCLPARLVLLLGLRLRHVLHDPQPGQRHRQQPRRDDALLSLRRQHADRDASQAVGPAGEVLPRRSPPTHRQLHAACVFWHLDRRRGPVSHGCPLRNRPGARRQVLLAIVERSDHPLHPFLLGDPRRQLLHGADELVDECHLQSAGGRKHDQLRSLRSDRAGQRGLANLYRPDRPYAAGHES